MACFFFEKLEHSESVEGQFLEFFKWPLLVDPKWFDDYNQGGNLSFVKII